MNPTFKFALLTPLAVLGTVLTHGPSAQAGWDNVFQVCCFDCDKPVRTSYYAAPAAPSPTSTTVRYEERAYYETRTAMVPERYQDQVPVQVKSYYYDPVTTYTRSSYRDPCTNECKDICVPKTCYVRKEQCNTVMKAVERMRYVPTEVRRKVVERRPVYTQTFYGPATRRYEDECDTPPAATPPRIDEFRSPLPSTMPSDSNLIEPTLLPINPASNPTRRLSPDRPQPNALTTSLESGTAHLQGEVVAADRVTPKSGTRVVFLNAKDMQDRRYTEADRFGNFDLELPAGQWHLYLGTGGGQAVYQKLVSVQANDTRTFKVVSR